MIFPFTEVSESNETLPARALTSASKRVPLTVPSVIHGSQPYKSVSAVKTTPVEVAIS